MGEHKNEWLYPLWKDFLPKGAHWHIALKYLYVMNKWITVMQPTSTYWVT